MFPGLSGLGFSGLGFLSLGSLDWHGPRSVSGKAALDLVQTVRLAQTGRWNMSAEARIQELGLELPPPPKPMGVYQPVVIQGRLAYLSGHGPLMSDGSLLTGRVGEQVDLAGGQAAARQTGLAILATLRKKLGSLDRVTRLIKSFGMVNCTAEFQDHPAVINGYSELMKEVFGSEVGVGARSAVGMGSLPGNITVEIEAILEIE